jgi:hypothetical protein
MLEKSPLRLTTFRHLAAAYTINELGNWIGAVALAILVFDRTGSALATAALFVGLRFVPALLAPLVTTRVEVLAVGRVLPAIYLAEAAIFAAIAWLAHRFSLPAVLVLAALDGILAITSQALTRSATVAALGPGERLRQGNAILNMGFTTAGAAGPAIAGLLVAAAGAGPALALDAISFVAVAVVVATARGLRIDTNLEGTSLGRLRAGLREVRHRPTVRRLLGGAAAALLFGAAVIPIEVVFAKRTLHAGDIGYGLLIAAWGAGMILGAAGFARASQVRLGVVVTAGMALIVGGYAGLAASPDLAIACAFSAVGGVGNGVWWIAVVTGVQQGIPAEVQSAVMAVLASVNQLMPALGFVMGGVVTALSSPRAAYGLAAGGVGVVLLVTLARPVREIDNRIAPEAPEPVRELDNQIALEEPL